MKHILQYILKIAAKIVLWRQKPTIVAVTGSVGKTGTKEAIYRVLRKRFRVRRNRKNYNNELGVPLTILGLETGGRSIFAWFKNFLKILSLVIRGKNYPDVLVLEMGVDRPGDMKYLVNFVPVTVGVITAIGQFPAHLEFFPEKGKLIEEKAHLVKSLKKDGLAILNYDDLSVRIIGDELPDSLEKTYYGFGKGADLRVSNFDLNISRLEKGDFSLNFKLDSRGSIIPVRMEKALGKQQAFAAAAAASVGLYFGMNLVEIAAGLKKFHSLPGRTKLLRGVKGTWIIDDTYNASPSSTLLALETLEQVSSKVEEKTFRKVIVLGDMLELGKDTEAGHRQVGEKVAEVADLLFTVGDRSRFISDQAKRQGMSDDNVFEFSQAEEAGLALQKKIKNGDMVLIKGSRSMHLEKVVKEIMAFPRKADKLLVR